MDGTINLPDGVECSECDDFYCNGTHGFYCSNYDDPDTFAPATCAPKKTTRCNECTSGFCTEKCAPKNIVYCCECMGEATRKLEEQAETIENLNKTFLDLQNENEELSKRNVNLSLRLAKHAHVEHPTVVKKLPNRRCKKSINYRGM